MDKHRPIFLRKIENPSECPDFSASAEDICLSSRSVMSEERGQRPPVLWGRPGAVETGSVPMIPQTSSCPRNLSKIMSWTFRDRGIYETSLCAQI